jgi:hypothetical protein
MGSAVLGLRTLERGPLWCPRAKVLALKGRVYHGVTEEPRLHGEVDGRPIHGGETALSLGCRMALRDARVTSRGPRRAQDRARVERHSSPHRPLRAAFVSSMSTWQMPSPLVAAHRAHRTASAPPVRRNGSRDPCSSSLSSI